MRGECSRHRRPKQQGFAKVSCDTGDLESSLREKALDLVTMSNNSVGGKALPVAAADPAVCGRAGAGPMEVFQVV